jgi:hypothetical protein
MLNRWPKGKVYNFENKNSIKRRQIIEDLTKYFRAALIPELKKLGYNAKNCKTAKDALEMARSYLLELEPKFIFDLIFRLIRIEQIPFVKKKSIKKIRNVCAGLTYNTVKEKYPYVAFVLELEIFFQIALAAELKDVKPEGNSLSDVEYLHYLPFCEFFVAYETFHNAYASLFMREEQKFISAEDMKQHLSEI